MNAPMTLEQIQQMAAQAAMTGPDMTEVVKGGGGARMLPEGYAFARLVEYIEFGQQPQEFNGQPKDPAMEVQLGFALTGAAIVPDPEFPDDPSKATRVPYNNDDGSPYIMRLFPMAMSRNEKARAFLLFKLLNWKNQYKHFGQMIGEAFLAKVVTYVPKDKTKKPSSTLDLKSFLPPLDPMSRQPYPIDPVRNEDLRVFFWDYPTIQGWDALKIDGTSEDGKSKNFIQDKIIAALDFSGSALEALLISGGKFQPPAKQVQSAAPAMAAPAMPATPTAPVTAPAAPAANPPFNPPHEPTAPAVQATVAVTPVVPAVVTAPAVQAAPAMPSMPVMPAMPVMP